MKIFHRVRALHVRGERRQREDRQIGFGDKVSINFLLRSCCFFLSVFFRDIFLRTVSYVTYYVPYVHIHGIES